jgi:hypothetical protein
MGGIPLRMTIYGGGFRTGWHDNYVVNFRLMTLAVIRRNSAAIELLASDTSVSAAISRQVCVLLEHSFAPFE